MSSSGADKHVADIMAVSDLLFYSVLAAFFVGFIYMVVLRFLGGIIIWISILAIILFTLGGAAFLYLEADKMTAPEEE